MEEAGKSPFLRYSTYLRDTYGQTVYRVAVDAGFSCPNRPGGRERGGCIYCDEHGARAPYLGDLKLLDDQIEKALSFLKRRYSAEAFLLYFQAFSSTHADVSDLKKIYDYGLGLYPFKGLVVSTRPDCLDGEKAALLSGYRREGFEVWVELGLQTACDKTLMYIRRGHLQADFDESFDLLKSYGLKVAVHVIFGLPGENWMHIEKTIQYLAKKKPDGIKIHNLNIPYGTVLLDDFMTGEMALLSWQRHLRYTVRALELLPKKTVIMRLTCDTLTERLAVPRRFIGKSDFYTAVEKEMTGAGTFQGKLY
jgi:uncharacterized protein